MDTSWKQLHKLLIIMYSLCAHMQIWVLRIKVPVQSVWTFSGFSTTSSDFFYFKQTPFHRIRKVIKMTLYFYQSLHLYHIPHCDPHYMSDKFLHYTSSKLGLLDSLISYKHHCSALGKRSRWHFTFINHYTFSQFIPENHIIHCDQHYLAGMFPH